MRKKELSLVVTFDSTAQAMAAEKYFATHSCPGRLIPVPREITAGCGLAWKAAPEARPVLLDGLESGGLKWAALHELEI